MWDQLLAALSQAHGADILKWKSYSVKAGWALRVKSKARTVVWLEPSESCFTVLFILGEKAMQVARQITLPQRIVKAMNEAPKYPEGTGLRLVVKTARDIGDPTFDFEGYMKEFDTIVMGRRTFEIAGAHICQFAFSSP